jgi:hypothetical protein
LKGAGQDVFGAAAAQAGTHGKYLKRTGTVTKSYKRLGSNLSLQRQKREDFWVVFRRNIKVSMQTSQPTVLLLTESLS